jgi:hypothetical protein
LKIVKTIAGGLLICIILLLAALRITGFGPTDGTPGLWLNGTLVTTTVTDWSFTDAVPTLEIQTNTWYLLPHSVTTRCATYNGQFYVLAFYPPGAAYPHGRHWNENVARDPHVRLKIAGKLYDRTLFHVTDPAEKTGMIQAWSKKYPQMKMPSEDTMQVFRIVG